MTSRSTDRAKLERRVIKTALLRYAEWTKQHGEPWAADFHDRKKAYAHLMATKALYEATRK